MAKQSPQSPFRVLAIFAAFLFVFLIVLDMFMIRSERKMRVETELHNVRTELDLIGTYITESMLRNDFATVEQFIMEWGKKDPDVVILTAFTPEGRILTQFKRTGISAHTFRVRRPVLFKDQKLLELEIVADLVDVERELAIVTKQLIMRSVFAIMVFGLISWLIFRMFALKPMEREIAKRRTAEEGLEQAVKERTAQLQATNIKLTEEVKERITAESRIRSSLREKEVLLQEVHHRVKNNLQVISSLLEIQLTGVMDVTSRDLLIESQSRLRTMAMVHEELYQSTNLDKVDFAHYVKRLVESLHRSYVRDPDKIRFLFDMEKMPLVVDTVIPCGLILNELVMNAIKHAFPGDRKGEVVITFKPLENNTFHLVVKDNGAGLPGDLDIANPARLGLRLVTMLVEQLHGTLKVANDHGTAFDISFKEYHEAGTMMY